MRLMCPAKNCWALIVKDYLPYKLINININFESPHDDNIRADNDI